MRKEFKSISIEMSYTKTMRNCQVEVTRKAELELSTETTFTAISHFLEDFKKVLQGYKHCMKAATYCNVYLSVGQYDKTESIDTMTQTSFDGWKFEGVPSCDDEGLYLSPDERYTNECHDIYLDFGEPLLEQLAQAHI